MKHSFLVLCLAVFLTASTVAQQSSGPDVIVGEIPSNSDYSNSGSIDAFSFGTTSCNKGDTPLNWFANTPDHPVIAQHVYRLLNGRFEMIGQSWLKHGFAALQGNVCGLGCSPNPNSTRLGVGCSDPYGSGLNGSQSGLGPKFEVNAHTGVFPIPFTGDGTSGNSVFKRVQIHRDDLDPAMNPGARYFVEAQYVARDDAASGNADNNASYREIVFSQSGANNFNVSFASGSSTMRETSAIEAWSAIDPGVEIRDVRVPGEGLFHVALRVTPNGPTTTYEFAIHNMNSDRSARSFSVNVPAGANITNVGFHDVAYHSGEPFDGTDWTPTVGGGTVSWATSGFGTNPNANALRWGTTYNFRFDSDMPLGNPVTGTLGLFKPGAPSSVQVSFAPPAALGLVSGDNQVGNVGEAFAQPLVVEVTSGGSPVPGQMVTFTPSDAAATVNPVSVPTDVNGRAQTTYTGGTLPGPITIDATTQNGAVQFNGYQRRHSVLVIAAGASANTIVVDFRAEQPNMPVTLAFDFPRPPVNLPFGTVCTSIINPQPGLVLTSAYPGVGFVDPTLVTNTNGTLTKVYFNVPATGLALVSQIYAVYNDGGLQILISNCDTDTY